MHLNTRTHRPVSLSQSVLIIVLLFLPLLLCFSCCSANVFSPSATTLQTLSKANPVTTAQQRSCHPRPALTHDDDDDLAQTNAKAVPEQQTKQSPFLIIHTRTLSFYHPFRTSTKMSVQFSIAFPASSHLIFFLSSSSFLPITPRHTAPHRSAPLRTTPQKHKRLSMFHNSNTVLRPACRPASYSEPEMELMSASLTAASSLRSTVSSETHSLVTTNLACMSTCTPGTNTPVSSKM